MSQHKPLIMITGASSGIGAATAELFASKGYPLCLIARRKSRLEALNLPNTLIVEGDITEEATWVRAVDEAVAAYGPVNALINNAGVMLLGDVATQDPAEWQTMLNVNVMGMLRGIQHVLPMMREQESGTIINVSSIAGRKTFPEHAAYCATKFAVHALTENIREENTAYNIRCVTIAPGVVKTELLSHTTDEQIKSDYREGVAQMEVLEPQDIAQSICFAYEMPQRVCIREIVICPTLQKL